MKTTVSPFLITSIERNSCADLNGGERIPLYSKEAQIKWIEATKVKDWDAFCSWCVVKMFREHRN